jgi:hypothetical protein
MVKTGEARRVQGFHQMAESLTIWQSNKRARRDLNPRHPEPESKFFGLLRSILV